MKTLVPMALLAAATFLAGAPPARAQAPAAADPRIERLLAQVSEPRLVAILEKLGSFGTRSTLSSTDSPTRGIGAARQWILDEMKQSSPRLQVAFDIHPVPKGGRIARDLDLHNVVALLPGRTPRRVYVTAHYDTFARVEGTAATRTPGAPPAGGAPAASPALADNPAPGVNDDGSGTALVMELARVFADSGIEFDATLAFVAFAGEEQGLIGARMHAERAKQQGIAIDAVLNNDMVGNTQAPGHIEDSRRVRVFSEAPEDSPSRQLARYVRAVGARYVPAQHVALIARHDRFGRGGDHTAFNQQGFAAVRLTEAVENYERQHTTADTLEGVNVPYFVRNVRVNAAAAASLALAPPAPAVVDNRGQPTLGRQPSGYDARLRWAPSPGAAGYMVYWREAWTPDWQHAVRLGNVQEHVIPGVSIDDCVFGVSAVGPDGQESAVAAFVNPPRR